MTSSLPPRTLADQSATGPATLIIGGIADGMGSVWAPVLVVCVGTMMAFGFASGWNFEDVNLFALGALRSRHRRRGHAEHGRNHTRHRCLWPDRRQCGWQRRDVRLGPASTASGPTPWTAWGNTTAATGKGFAIGSAALTALALLAAYVEEVRVGFERWGADIAVTLEDDGFYKASPGFVIHKQGENVKTYLFMPDDRRHEHVETVWGRSLLQQERAGTCGRQLLSDR